MEASGSQPVKITLKVDGESFEVPADFLDPVNPLDPIASKVAVVSSLLVPADDLQAPLPEIVPAPRLAPTNQSQSSGWGGALWAFAGEAVGALNGAVRSVEAEVRKSASITTTAAVNYMKTTESDVNRCLAEVSEGLESLPTLNTLQQNDCLYALKIKLDRVQRGAAANREVNEDLRDELQFQLDHVNTHLGDIAPAVEMLQKGKISLEEFESRQTKLEDLQSAFDDMIKQIGFYETEEDKQTLVDQFKQRLADANLNEGLVGVEISHPDVLSFLNDLAFLNNYERPPIEYQ